MARVRITKKIPKALSGLEMKMSAGLYGKGTNGNSQFRSSGTLEAGKISQQPTEVRNTLQPVARENANLEAEKGETAMVNIDGIPAHFKIGGKRHSKGGTPLNLPDNSFIFSDTAKMKITDPIMLAQFGMVPKKSGYTPAEIAKKYDINKYRQILADPNTDDIDRTTAEMMISNYNMKLAKLSLLQESKKGFPQGIPVVAMPYISEMEMNPEEFTSTQAETDEPDADMGVSKYGGGLYKAQEGLSDIQAATSYLREQEAKREKEKADYEARQEASRLYNEKIKRYTEDIRKTKSEEASAARLLKEVADKKEKVSQYLNEIKSGKEKMGMFNYPVDKVSKESQLKKAIYEYEQASKRAGIKEPELPRAVDVFKKDNAPYKASSGEQEYYSKTPVTSLLQPAKTKSAKTTSSASSIYDDMSIEELQNLLKEN